MQNVHAQNELKKFFYECKIEFIQSMGRGVKRVVGQRKRSREEEEARRRVGQPLACGEKGEREWGERRQRG